MALTPIRRVVTGNDANGKSKVVWDGPSPGVHETQLPGVGGGKVEGREDRSEVSHRSISWKPLRGAGSDATV